MATLDKTFSTANYDYDSYVAKRPPWPQGFIDQVLKYHTGAHDHYLDLGCGPGNVTRLFAPHFARATGTDPSDGMLAAAAAGAPASNIAWKRGTSTDFPADLSPPVDLVTAGQAAHWFPWPATWASLARVVRPGGTVAFFAYSDVVLPESAAASDVVLRWLWGEHLREHWVWPGRGVVERLYADVVAAAPQDEWTDVRWVRADHRREHAFFADEGRVHPGADAVAREAGVSDADRAQLLMQSRMSVARLKALMRTWSGCHHWTEAHPHDKPRADGGKGDIADWMWDEVVKVEPSWAGEDKDVLVRWPVAIVLARRK